MGNRIHKRGERYLIKVGFLGIDGSGKSTHAKEVEKWLKSKGYKVKVVHFHKYIFTDKIARIVNYLKLKKKVKTKDEYTPILPKNPQSRRSQIRCYLASIDNLILYTLSLLKYKNYDIVIYDRFPWATYIKYKALGYNVDLVKKVFMKPSLDYCIIFDIPVDVSIKRVLKRGHEKPYPKKCLERERKFYINLAKKNRYPIIKTEKEKPEESQKKVKKYIEKILSTVKK